MEIRPYPESLEPFPQGTQKIALSRPEENHIVLGAGCKPERDIWLQHVEKHPIPIFKRKGGGGTVLLGPHTLILTIHAGVGHPFGHKIYFQAINRALISTLKKLRDLAFDERGISDLAVQGKKILGSSLYRRKGLLLFQGSLLIEDAIEEVERYLQPPPRQPDYRQDRDHRNFMTCLRELGINDSWDDLMSYFQTELPIALSREFESLPEAYR